MTDQVDSQHDDDHDHDRVTTSPGVTSAPRAATIDVPAGRSIRAWIVVLVLLTAGLVSDLWSKQAAFAKVGPQPIVLTREAVLSDAYWRPPPGCHREVIPHVLDLRLVLNQGAVFGIGKGQRWFFITFTVTAMLVGFFIFAFRTRASDWLAHVALAAILSGAAGNFYDRVMFAGVRDFLNLFPKVYLPFGWHWPGGSAEIFPWVFNIADMLLLIGIGLLMLRVIFEAPEEAPVEDDAA